MSETDKRIKFQWKSIEISISHLISVEILDIFTDFSHCYFIPPPKTLLLFCFDFFLKIKIQRFPAFLINATIVCLSIWYWFLLLLLFLLSSTDHVIITWARVQYGVALIFLAYFRFLIKVLFNNEICQFRNFWTIWKESFAFVIFRRISIFVNFRKFFFFEFFNFYFHEFNRKWRKTLNRTAAARDFGSGRRWFSPSSPCFGISGGRAIMLRWFLFNWKKVMLIK